ncbi:MAG TPA: GNAT family N-acetyltransferase [Solirubrobacterales bacterium]
MERLPERIEGEGLLLRRWTVKDAELLDAALAENLEHLRPWMPWIAAEPLSLTTRRGMLSRWERDWRSGGDVVLGIFEGERVAGSTGLHHRHGPRTLAIGYWVHVDFLRRGVATRTARLLTETALALPGVDRVEIHHDKANLRSAAVPRRLGYRFLGETPDRVEAPGEAGVDCGWRIEEWPARAP